jgi:ABC-type glycerol-3-phosphate transport system substrate-binding protein
VKGKLLLVSVLMVLMLALSGCGGGPKPDVAVFMMSSKGIPTEVGDKLQQWLVGKVGEAPTLRVVTTPVFSMEKLVVEIAAGDNGIIVVPTEQFKAIGLQGGYVSLDGIAKPEDFPEGVMEQTADGKKETHLYGIPLENTKWFKELNLNGKDLFAFIPVNAPNQEKAIEVMKHIAQK